MLRPGDGDREFGGNLPANSAADAVDGFPDDTRREWGTDGKSDTATLRLTSKTPPILEDEVQHLALSAGRSVYATRESSGPQTAHCRARDGPSRSYDLAAPR